jgi:hypothetical protein
MDKATRSLLGAALGYAAGGWKVFPLRAEDGKKPLPNCSLCRPQTDGSRLRKPHRPDNCPCTPKGRTCHGAYAATSDPELIHRWWTAPYGIAVACGPSNLVVLDCDDHGGIPPEEPVPARPGSMFLTPRTGMEVMMMLAQANGHDDLFSSTAVTVTPGGGRQLLFTAPDAGDFQQDSHGKVGWQVDVKSGMIQTTLAPTIRPDGVYRWADPDVPVAPLPDWIRSLLVDSRLHIPTEEAKRPVRVPGAPKKTFDRATVNRVFSRQLNAVRACTGGVSWQLSRSAFVLGKLVARNAAPYDATAKMLFDAAFLAVTRNNLKAFDEYKTMTVIENALDEGIDRADEEDDETQVTSTRS